MGARARRWVCRLGVVTEYTKIRLNQVLFHNNSWLKYDSLIMNDPLDDDVQGVHRLSRVAARQKKREGVVDVRPPCTPAIVVTIRASEYHDGRLLQGCPFLVNCQWVWPMVRALCLKSDQTDVASF